MKCFLSLLILPLLGGCAELAASLDTMSLSSEGRNDGPTGPQERDLYLDLIAGLQEKDLHRASLAHLDEYDKRFRPTARSLRLRAEAYTVVGPDSLAVATWKQLIGTADEAAAYNGLGRIYAGAGQWDDASDAFRSAVAKEPTNARYVNNYGFALLRAGNREQAEFRLLQAEELDRDNAEIRSNVILVLLANGKSTEADARLARIADAGARANLRRDAVRVAAALPPARRSVPADSPESENHL
ncbi:tetratricopeptide repeat protein [Roseomonas chloroacetimidivorans]|uniref:tetratricopeptide repeat protein n=1 Tax=Roseomonas chloroacetimidivorans TaxID=1766656 RepID=UPI003C70E73E